MMENRLEDLSPQELMDYMNRIVNKHLETKQELKHAPSANEAGALLERMVGLSRLFTNARLLSESRGYQQWH